MKHASNQNIYTHLYIRKTRESKRSTHAFEDPITPISNRSREQILRGARMVRVRDIWKCVSEWRGVTEADLVGERSHGPDQDRAIVLLSCALETGEEAVEAAKDGKKRFSEWCWHLHNRPARNWELRAPVQRVSIVPVRPAPGNRQPLRLVPSNGRSREGEDRAQLFSRPCAPCLSAYIRACIYIYM